MIGRKMTWRLSSLVSGLTSETLSGPCMESRLERGSCHVLISWKLDGLCTQTVLGPSNFTSCLVFGKLHNLSQSGFPHL